MTQQDAVRLIRKLIFAKNSQDLTHFNRCVDEIAQTLDEQGDKKALVLFAAPPVMAM